MKFKLKKGDTVKVISGESRGQQGKISFIDTKSERAIVDGVNIIIKHEKPSAKTPNGGRVEKEGSIHISNLMFLEAGKTIRIGRVLNEVINKIERVSKKTKLVIK